MAQMNISNTLWNDTKEGKIALAKQLFDDVVDWDSYYYYGDDGNKVYPFKDAQGHDLYEKFQDRLNNIFLTHYVEYQVFLHTKGIEGVIDTWKDVEDFLKDITDDETMTLMKLIGDLEEASGQLNIRMSEEHPGMIEAVTKTDIPAITKSHLDPETGAINIVYTFE